MRLIAGAALAIVLASGSGAFAATIPFQNGARTQAQANAVAFGAVTSPAHVAGGAASFLVTATNTGSAAWNATGAAPVALSYHWHDAAGRLVVWDGVRSALPTNVAPGAAVTIAARVIAPATPGRYTLTLDLVREGVTWFQAAGGTPLHITTEVEAQRWAAHYDVPTGIVAGPGTTTTMPVRVTNTGNTWWNAGGGNPVALSYHVYDVSGRLLVWDGLRTALGADLGPGEARTLALAFAAPSVMGGYVLRVEAVREGISWFGGYGSPLGHTRLLANGGFNAGYLATTTPVQATSGALLDLTVDVVNYGPATLASTGPNPVVLSYHVRTSSGATVIWDGQRGVLPREIPAGQTLVVPIQVRLPTEPGAYVIAWDLVQEGIAWFTGMGMDAKVEPINVAPGVTFFGKGNGHGVGMSQYGAQGWATGAAGPPLTGEQIVMKYYTGSEISAVDTSGPNNGMRVLLSVPSSTGSFSCGSPALNTAVADAVSVGGFRVVSEAAGNAVIAVSGGSEPWQIIATAGVVQVWNRGPAVPVKVYEGTGAIVLVPSTPSLPIHLVQKGVYRGTLRFTNLSDALKVINFVSYDDYVKGVIRKEMPAGWHREAYKAQAYAARSYAYTSYKGTASDHDVRDDQADQCYGGVAAETAETNAAVDATAGRFITHQGQVVRAYFSSSSGGMTVPVGCWGSGVQLLGGRYVCSAGAPYLQAVADPADLLVSVPTTNRHASWNASFTSDQVRDAVLRIRGVDIGSLSSVDVSNTSPAGSGHVVSVVVRGTRAVVDIPADVLLRTHLGLRSTMVRLVPF